MNNKLVNKKSHISLGKRIHKTSPDNKKYSIFIPYVLHQCGLGDALSNIIISYSDQKMFGKPKQHTDTGYIKDQRPQIIITDHSNHNNIMIYVEDRELLYECCEGAMFRRNLNLQRLSRKHVFWQSCKIIQEDLFLSLFARNMMLSSTGNNDVINNSLFAMLPDELIELIINAIKEIGLFNTSYIEMTQRSKDYCY